MTDTGHVTMRTRDMRMARRGTRKIPSRTHCTERGRGVHVHRQLEQDAVTDNYTLAFDIPTEQKHA